ncbi:hypothetical protein AOV_04170 [Anaplasma ovis str. Haibei]|uniref:Uncharacterized protein n=1 Tax=Anaplasma ovis str. Haibei TaxID=1248439 RepID=A0A2Z2LFB2_9RICK|nr:hypothetical protein AOV_04170 [Anaplasma ovis str. Haibei]
MNATWLTLKGGGDILPGCTCAWLPVFISKCFMGGGRLGLARAPGVVLQYGAHAQALCGTHQ